MRFNGWYTNNVAPLPHHIIIRRAFGGHFFPSRIFVCCTTRCACALSDERTSSKPFGTNERSEIRLSSILTLRNGPVTLLTLYPIAHSGYFATTPLVKYTVARARERDNKTRSEDDIYAFMYILLTRALRCPSSTPAVSRYLCICIITRIYACTGCP